MRTTSLSLSSSHSAEHDDIGRLDERIRRWIWQRGWTSLRDAQQRAIPALINADRDVIIAAATAAGKTEAAFFPILTHLLTTEESGLVIYISPLKALINDQWQRLDELCETLGLAVTRWHGDVSYDIKRRFLANPRGVLLITPESLEALFIRRGAALAVLLAGLRYIVIDEMHAYIGDERGKQLQSLMHRLDLVLGRSVPRVGLSATLGDMRLAAAYLRSQAPDQVTLIESNDGKQQLSILVKCYLLGKDVDAMDEGSPLQAICNHLYRILRGTNNLVFPNSRSAVEVITDQLRQRCERDRLPNEFWAHHGSLSQTYRAEAEKALKSGATPATAICTSTLELGIDIGAVKNVCQLGRPPAVASLRQRLGRSGRRPGESAILRGYLIERELRPGSSMSDLLRESMIQTIAMIRLLIEGWFEPPEPTGMHASTLVHQIMSMIAERNGATAAELWSWLLAPGAPFAAAISKTEFLQLLTGMGQRDLITQDKAGHLLHGRLGERLINDRDFYATFASAEEFRLMHGSTELGTLPLSLPLMPGQRVIMAGQRWEVLQINEQERAIYVTPSKSGAIPPYESAGTGVHDRVRQEMKTVLAGDFSVPFLDVTGQEMLAEARETFNLAGLQQAQLIGTEDVLALTWAGSKANNALVLLLDHLGLSATNEGLVIRIDEPRDDVLTALQAIAKAPLPSPEALLMDNMTLCREKWDWALPRALLCRSYASLHLDLLGAKRIAHELSKTGAS
ncbi:TPA: DEAD/DEAH box helicase [Aeromonas hydrophila subsp. hydrophila]|nr:DEAD/DEAH box helicase [Aeromonas caviae]